ncbi:hypothetical protein BSKO_01280 [Bryopsis sp. KO-2023]|nr:hypothetical protein BSKO_01280 [Bryopsis sp. KO-2023]
MMAADIERTEVPLVDFVVPGFDRPKRLHYDATLAERALVLDNGSYRFRAGWSGEDRPRLEFSNQIIRPRSRWTNELMTVVGDIGGGVKGFDFGRASARNAFDGNVVVNFETQEVVLDYVFDRLALPGDGGVVHPVIMTEPCLNPSYSRAQMAELLFEAYEVPAVHFAADSPCAYAFNRKIGRCGPTGLLLGSGHSATHVVPIVDGEPYFQASRRMKPCGAIATDLLCRHLQLAYPQHNGILTATNASLIKQDYTYCSENYSQDLKKIQTGGALAGGHALRVQLPFHPVDSPSEKEMALAAAEKAAKMEGQRRRLREMTEKRKLKQIQEKEEVLEYWRNVANQASMCQSYDAVESLLQQTGLSDIRDIHKRIEEVEFAIKRLKGKNVDGSKLEHCTSVEPVDPSGRKPKRDLEEDEIRKQELLEFDRDGDIYIETLKQRHKECAERLESRKRRRLGAASHPADVGELGPGRRVTTGQRHRMRLLAQAAGGEKLQKDDGFGIDDRDWDVYKEMDRNHSDSDMERDDEAEYKRTASLLQELGEGSSVIDLTKEQHEKETSTPQQRAEQFQISLTVDRIRVPELLFQPSLCGIDQAGLVEVVGGVLQQLPVELADRCANGGLLITGGNAAYPGLDARLEVDLRSIRPQGKPIRVIRSDHFSLDAWRGASLIADTPGIFTTAFTRAEYQECGVDVLRRMPSLSYAFN